MYSKLKKKDSGISAEEEAERQSQRWWTTPWKQHLPETTVLTHTGAHRDYGSTHGAYRGSNEAKFLYGEGDRKPQAYLRRYL